jgi:hypothetical protein
MSQISRRHESVGRNKAENDRDDEISRKKLKDYYKCAPEIQRQHDSEEKRNENYELVLNGSFRTEKQIQ